MKKVMVIMMAMVMAMVINVTSYASIFTGKPEEPKFQQMTEIDLSDVIEGTESRTVRNGDRGVVRVSEYTCIWEVKNGVVYVTAVDNDNKRIDYQVAMVTNGHEYRAYTTINGEDATLDVTNYFTKK